MSAPHRIARAAFVLLGCACARPTAVELRLHACALAGEVPVRVDLEIRGVDAEGTALPVLEDSYEIDPQALADGYATVALRKPAGMVDADFTLTWHDGRGGTEVSVLLHRPVPAAGEVLELGAERCMAPDPGTTGDASSTGSTSGDTTTAGSTSTTAVTSSSSGDDDTSTSSSSTGASTGDTTTTGESTSSTGSTGDTTSGTTGEPTMEGMTCPKDKDFLCENGGPGQVGKVLLCTGGEWKESLQEVCSSLFEFNCESMEVALVMPVLVGCNSIGADGFTCVCKDKQPVACDPLPGCDPDTEVITLCVDDERAQAKCSVACTDDSGPLCVE